MSSKNILLTMRRPFQEWNAFLIETRCRLGTVDSLPERIILGSWREIKAVFRSRKRFTSFSMALILVGLNTVPAFAQMTVTDPLLMQQNATMAAKLDIRSELAKIWNDNRENMRWVTDLVQSYRQVKMAKTAYESIATFDLSKNIAVVDILPQINLEPGYLFGSPADGFSEGPADNNGDYSRSYLSIRFRTRDASARSITDWTKFKPKLKVNVNDIASQLANLDFDAIQTVQYCDSLDRPIGSPIQKGDPQAAVGAVLGYWNQMLAKVNNWALQKREEQEQQAALEDQISRDQAIFDQQLTALQAACDEQDQANRKQLASLGLSKGATRSTYQDFYAPKVRVLVLMKQARDDYYRKKTQEKFNDLTKMKANNEAVQRAVTNQAEVAKILAENALIRNKFDQQFRDMLGKCKDLKNDKGESVDTILGSITLQSADLQNMRFPREVSDMIVRMQGAMRNALEEQRMKLDSLRISAEDLKVMDTAGSANYEAEKKLVELTQAMSWVDEYEMAQKAQAANQAYSKYCASLQQQRLTEEQAKNKELYQSLEDGNQAFFDFFQKKGVTSAASVFEKLANAYGSTIKAFFGHQILSDVMGANGASMGAMKGVDLTEEWNMYQKAIGGVL